MAKKYIDAEILKAEIERLKEKAERRPHATPLEGFECMGKIKVYNELISFIDSFHQEQNSIQDSELTGFESALFTAFSYAWQSYLRGEEVNVVQWAKENSAELLEAARCQQEQQEVDLEKEIDSCWQNWLSPSNQKEVEGVLPKTEFAMYARHFYKLGKNSK